MGDEDYDVIVIGAGAAGLTAAGGCGLYGLRTALIERGAMGGECLNTGCVPSKALLAAAAAAHRIRTAGRFGVHAGAPEIDFAGVRAHIRRAIETIAPHDSAATMTGYGVTVIAGDARFRSPHRVAVAGRVLRAPRIVLATGSRPSVPAIPGLDAIPFLSTDTVWDLAELPAHLAILGAGAVGAELAQAFRRLGAAVTLLDPGPFLARADRDAATLLRATLEAEGVTIHDGVAVTQVAPGPTLHLASGATIAATHLLLAAGRTAMTEGLGLEAAGLAAGPDGLAVDAGCRTAVRHILAIGDCRAGPRLTHVAGHEGSVAVQRIALGWPATAERARLPQVVFTDPELAQLGQTEAAARAAGGAVQTDVAPFADDDRAVAEAEAAGFVKVVRRRGRIVGVTAVGAGAGELLLPWSQIMAGRASRFALSGAVVAYPTRSERSKAAAFDGLRPTLFHPALRRWARLLAQTRRVPHPSG